MCRLPSARDDARSGPKRQDGPVEYGYIGAGFPKVSLSRQTMSNPLEYLAPVAVGAVAIILVLGLFNMMRGGSPNRSQQLMRWRVMLQFVAIIVMMTALYFGTR
jgi:hypothetical protein